MLAHFARRELLEADLLTVHPVLRDDVRLHQVATRSDEGWLAHTQVLQQEAGLRWSGNIDLYGATLLAACDGSQTLLALLEVLAAGAGITVGEATEQVLPVVHALVAQGFLGRA